MGAIDRINFLGLTRKINPVEQVAARGAKCVSRTPQKNPSIEAAVSAVNGELAPKYLNTATKGSAYTNGIGYSEFGAFKPYLA